jgi:NADH-quinone oxidoreductase subunit J
VGLFAVIVAAALNAEFGSPQGFESCGSITAGIGRALFNLGAAGCQSEGFLATFEIVDLVLVAALVVAVMLARREVGGSLTGALRTDGGEEE